MTQWSQVLAPVSALSSNYLEQVVHTHVPLLPSSIMWYWPMGRLAESNSSLLPGGWLKVTCGLTGCTPGSALGNEYGRTLLFLTVTWHCEVTVVQLPVAECRSPTSVECGAKMTVQGTVAGRACLHSKSSVSDALQVRPRDIWSSLIVFYCVCTRCLLLKEDTLQALLQKMFNVVSLCIDICRQTSSPFFIASC